MGQGDILLLYTDGLTDGFSEFTPIDLGTIVSRVLSQSAVATQSDDLSLVVIKRL